jgi:ubiquitin C-terminal hydrolase
MGSGSLRSGHYTALTRNPGDGRWYYYNDERVFRVRGPIRRLLRHREIQARIAVVSYKRTSPALA